MFVIFVASSVRLQAAKITKKSGSTLGRWQTLFRATNAVGTRQLPEKSPLKSLDEFTITGAYEKHVNRLNQVVCDGQWGISQGVLSQISGRAAAIKIGRAKEFELEAGIQAEGVGGWFIVFGYDQGHGYGVYNVTMNQSGSPWFITEFRDGKGILDSDKELVRYECKGKETLKLRVVNEKVSLSIGNRKIMEDVELAGIHEGDIILGTYDTKYGPKPVKIYGIRLRTPK
ncbi:MAG: hypothetical protein JKY95_06725 [Planctomycetaceae bacterium]|nr:hypothetical protein [Planctomycetaceae bacterium]